MDCAQTASRPDWYYALQVSLSIVTDISAELCYSFKYIERNNHTQGQAWSERQIGVYHRFGTKGKAVMLLLHASTDTKALRRLRQVFANGQYSEQSETTAFLLHVLVLSSYLDNWRAYLQELGAWCLKKVIACMICLDIEPY